MSTLSPAAWGLPVEQPRAIYLYPGEVFVSSEAAQVSTILGSCVAVCLWDPSRRQGGLNHFLLPSRIRASEPSTRFAEPALQDLLKQLARFGSDPRDLVAKVFGGACVMRALPADGRHLGAENAEAAHQGLAKAGIRVVGGQVGGARGMRLVFNTGDGSAWIKEL